MMNKIYNEDCRDTMLRMPDNFIDLTVTSPPYDCYTDDTEILTKDGWKLIKDVKIEENILSVNPINKNIEYCKVVDTFNYKIHDDIIHFKSQDIDLKVTKNHKMYVEDGNGEPVRERKPFIKKEYLNSSYFKDAINIKSSDKLPYKGFIWKGEKRNVFYLPELKCLYNKQYKTYPVKKIKMLWWVRFLGIYLSEGSCRGTKKGLKNGRAKCYEISIKQKNLKITDLIRNILKKLPFPYKERKDKIS